MPIDPASTRRGPSPTAGLPATSCSGPSPQPADPPPGLDAAGGLPAGPSCWTDTPRSSEVPCEALRRAVIACGTPTYTYDLACIRRQVARLRTHLPPQVEVLYSLKANASLGLCGFLAQQGLGADVASAGELAIALQAGFPPSRIFLTGPDKSPPVLQQLAALPEVLVSLDSLSELPRLGQCGLRRRAILRLRPNFCSHASCAAGPDSRFGALLEELPAARSLLAQGGVELIGFHIFAGSQVLSAQGIIEHLRGAVEQSLRAGEILDVVPQIIDIGGGFGTPYAPQEQELDLAPIGAELQRLVRRAAPARIVIELGRYLVAQSGWYLTRVIALQSHRGRPAVVVDGGTHQRADVCGIGLRQRALPPVVLRAEEVPYGAGSAISGAADGLLPTDVLGCLSLPSDILAEAAPLPPLRIGDLLAFPNAGAYGLYAAAWQFHAHPPPAEVAWEGDRMEVLRERGSVDLILQGQRRLAGSRPQGPMR
jgi:diaminopimelate decarboxylase